MEHPRAARHWVESLHWAVRERVRAHVRTVRGARHHRIVDDVASRVDSSALARDSSAPNRAHPKHIWRGEPVRVRAVVRVSCFEAARGVAMFTSVSPSSLCRERP
jgi:hypothetical protein